MPGWLDPDHDCDDGYWNDESEPDFDDLSDPLNDEEWIKGNFDKLTSYEDLYQYNAHVDAFWRQAF